MRADDLLRLLSAAAVIAVTLACINLFGVGPTRESGDPWNYLAAAERLNDGHPLYSLSPGDRPVELSPPYWSAPLLSPPFIAVLWRPLALLGEVSMLLWWITGVAAIAVFTAWVLARGSQHAVLGLVALSPVLALTALSGNAMALLVPLLALRLPIAVAMAAAVKLSPALLVPAVGWRAVAPWGLACAVVSLAGAGIDNHVAWLQTVASTAPTPASIHSLTGLPGWVILAAAAALALRGWRWAVLAATFATPVVHFAALSLLAAGLPPKPGTSGASQSGPPR